MKQKTCGNCKFRRREHLFYGHCHYCTLTEDDEQSHIVTVGQKACAFHQFRSNIINSLNTD